MQNQSPVVIREIHAIHRTWNGGQAGIINRFQAPVEVALDTKVGAIPANFFFSL
jgi:hypothetical protein